MPLIKSSTPGTIALRGELLVGLSRRLSHHLATTARVWGILEVIKPRPRIPMQEGQLQAFLEAVRADAGLQEKLKAAGDADAVVAIAKAAGFVISANELQKPQPAELSDEELEGVAGGCLCNTEGFWFPGMLPSVAGTWFNTCPGPF